MSSFREPFLKKFTKLNCFVTLHFSVSNKITICLWKHVSCRRIWWMKYKRVIWACRVVGPVILTTVAKKWMTRFSRNPYRKWWNAQLNISYGMLRQAVQLRQNMGWAKICELFIEILSWKSNLQFKTFNTELHLTQV